MIARLQKRWRWIRRRSTRTTRLMLAIRSLRLRMAAYPRASAVANTLEAHNAWMRGVARLERDYARLKRVCDHWGHPLP